MLTLRSCSIHPARRNNPASPRRGTRRLVTGIAALIVMSGACRENPSATPAPARIVALRLLSGDTLEVPIGSARLVSLEGVDERGHAATVTAAWNVDDWNVASVDERGLVRAQAYGMATVTATYGSLSVKVMIKSVPAALRVRLEGGGNVVEPGQQFIVHAEFLAVDGRVVRVPWEVSWSASPGLELNKGDGPDDSRVVIRPSREGEFDVTASARNLRKTLKVWVFSTVELLQVVEFRMGLLLGRSGWTYYPDLVVATSGDIQITRISFEGLQVACGAAALPRRSIVPLFDFQPYNFSWRANPRPFGSEVVVEITATLPDGKGLQRRATGRVEANLGFIDHGTEGFRWSSCV